MNNTNFSNDSDVTLVITSCGRMDLLEKTLESFFLMNSYPIKKAVIIDDAGDERVHGLIPDEYRNYFTVLLNKENLGQIASIDRAYAEVDTAYIFHCEDDWEFYRKGFIEQSKAILQTDEKICQVWLRSYYHDLKTYPHLSLGQRHQIDGFGYFKLESSKKKWQGFSFNPGLRRFSDYKKLPSGYSGFLGKIAGGALSAESAISMYMGGQGYYAMIVEDDCVFHIGDGFHIADPRQKRKKTLDKITYLVLVILIFLSGYWLG